MSAENLEKISKVTKPGAEAIEKIKIPANREYFETLMQEGKKPEEIRPEKNEEIDKDKITLMDELSKDYNRSESRKLSTDTLVAQAEQTVIQIEEAKTTLQDPNLVLKRSVQNILRSKLTHIDHNLKIALDKVDVKQTAPPELEGLARPVYRFLAYLTHGQDQLMNLSSHVKELGSRDELSMASVLSLQIKVQAVQNEIEFFTNLLNKGLESTKTIMNVQV